MHIPEKSVTSMESRTETRITTFAKIGNAVETFFDKLRRIIAYCLALDRVSRIFLRKDDTKVNLPGDCFCYLGTRITFVVDRRPIDRWSGRR